MCADEGPFLPSNNYDVNAAYAGTANRGYNIVRIS